MAIRSLLVVCSILCALGHADVLRQRGVNDSTALYWNHSSVSTSSTASGPPLLATSTFRATQEPPYPLPGTATNVSSSDSGRPRSTDQGHVKSPVSGNSTRPACTVNIASASIDWWYAATYQYGIATLTSFRANNTDGESYLKTVPVTKTFDVQSALETDYAFTTSESYDSDWGWTWTNYEAYTVTPSAAMTSVISRTALVPLPTGSFAPANDIYQYAAGVDNLAPATAAIIGAPNSTFVATSATPFLYFSAYEVESTVGVTSDDGRVDSSVTTQTFKLANVHAYPYWLKGIEDYATATGVVPAEFLQEIPQSACSVGSFQAIVTVLVVVDLIYIDPPIGAPFLVHIESTVTGFEEVATEDPIVIVFNTAKPETTSHVGPPVNEHSADRFSSSKAATAATLTSAGDNVHNAGSGISRGVKIPEQTSRVTAGTVGTNPIVIVGPSSVVIVGSQTLLPGGPTITIGGQPVFLPSSATAIVVGGKTSGLPQVITPTAQPRPPPILTLGSLTLTGNAATQFLIAPGQTLTAGGTVVFDGTSVSLDPSASFIVVAGSTQILNNAAPVVTLRPEIVIGGSTITANPRDSGAGPTFVISGTTLAPGQIRTVDGTVVSLAPSGSFVVVGGSTQILPTAGPGVTAAPEITFGGSTITANPGNPGAAPTFVISGTTLAPGQVETIDGTVVSLAPSGSFIVIGGSTQTLSTAVPVVTAPPEIIIGGSTITANTGNSDGRPTFIVSGQTLVPGGIITVEGTTISLGPSGSFVVVNGATSTLANPAAAQITAPPLTIGNVVFTALPGQGTTYVIGTHTLTPGGAITVADTTISLAPGATALIINGITTLLPLTTSQAPIITNPPLLTIGSQTFTAVPGTGTTFLIGFETLTPGGTITVDGTTIILAPGATELTYGSSGRTTSTALFPATTTRSPASTRGGKATNEPLAGATPTNGEAAATTLHTGAGWSVKEQVRVENWGVTVLTGILGMLMW